ncbi:hypothetical protein GBAR_LOCUS25957 [Geodia barretti]|uniref:Uncharacterized protein n=1 Tax=Geodia barretti TaxID=519541 RepID=A0AA35TH02_GEOBA|nr:hypothetical protein GBAR_LOCUS25957 [Geodia barretti]
MRRMPRAVSSVFSPPVMYPASSSSLRRFSSSSQTRRASSPSSSASFSGSMSVRSPVRMASWSAASSWSSCCRSRIICIACSMDRLSSPRNGYWRRRSSMGISCSISAANCAISRCVSGSRACASASSISCRASGRHALQHRLHLRQLLLQHLHQLVEALRRVVAEHLAPFVHESVEVRLAALQPVPHHLVDVPHHLPCGFHVLGRHVLDLLLHLLAHVLRHLALQHIQQFLELLLRLRIHEVVLHELLELTPHALRQVVQLVQVSVGPLLQQVEQRLLLLLLVLRCPVHLLTRLVQPVLDAATLGVDNFLQPLLQVVHHRVHVVLLHLLTAPFLQLLHKLPHPRHLLAIPVLHPLPEQVPQRLHDVAVVQDILRQHVHQLVGIDIEDVLGSVPLGVPVSAK